MTDHGHEFDDAPPGAVAFCVDFRCHEMAVRTKDGWRELTPKERTEATFIMWEDTLIMQAMQIIHGKDRGPAHARKVLGYTKRGTA